MKAQMAMFRSDSFSFDKATFADFLSRSRRELRVGLVGVCGPFWNEAERVCGPMLTLGAPRVRLERTLEGLEGRLVATLLELCGVVVEIDDVTLVLGVDIVFVLRVFDDELVESSSSSMSEVSGKSGVMFDVNAKSKNY